MKKKLLVLLVVFTMAVILIPAMAFAGASSAPTPQEPVSTPQADTQAVTFNIRWDGWNDPALNGQARTIPVLVYYTAGGRSYYESSLRMLDVVVGTNKAFTFDLPLSADGNAVDYYAILTYHEGNNEQFGIARSNATLTNINYYVRQGATGKVSVTVNVLEDVQTPAIMPNLILTYPDYWERLRTQTLPLAQENFNLWNTARFQGALYGIYTGLYSNQYPMWSRWTGDLSRYKMQASLSDSSRFVLRPLEGSNTAGSDKTGWTIIADARADAIQTVTFDPTDKATATDKTEKKLFSGEKLSAATAASVPVPEPIEGYLFLGWSLDGETVTDTTAVEVFHGDSLPQEFLDTLPIPAPIPGYRFLGWSLDGQTVLDNLLDITVKGDVTFLALYEKNPRSCTGSCKRRAYCRRTG